MQNLGLDNKLLGLLYELTNYCQDSSFAIQRSLDEKNIEMIQLLHVDSFDSKNKAIQNKITEAFSAQLKVFFLATLLKIVKHLLLNHQHSNQFPEKFPSSLETILWILAKLGSSYFLAQIRKTLEVMYGLSALSKIEQFLNVDSDIREKGSKLSLEPTSIDDYVKSIQSQYAPWLDKTISSFNKTTAKPHSKALSSFQLNDMKNKLLPKSIDWKENNGLKGLSGNWTKLKINTLKDASKDVESSSSSTTKERSALKVQHQDRQNRVITAETCHLNLEEICLLKSSTTFEFNQMKSNLKISTIKGLCRQNIEFYDQIQPKLAKTGSLYIDDAFGPELTSLTSNIAEFPIAEKIVWKRVKDIFPDSSIKVCSDNIGPNDIRQGELGDCYFLSALSVLAEQKEFIKRLFHSKDVTPTGCYSIWLCDSGEWKNVIIDDFIPCKQQDDGTFSPCFSRSKGDDIWVVLLEKAFAKLFGNYHNIDGGNLSEALTTLTGAPVKHFKEKNNDIPLTDQLWHFLTNNLSNKFPITAASRGKSMVGHHKHLNVISDHAYAVLDVKELKINSTNDASPQAIPINETKRKSRNAKEVSYERIIKMRNPWGFNIRESQELLKRSQQLSSLVNSQVENDDARKEEEEGTFWISLDDFGRSFRSICACEIHNDYYFSFIRLGELQGQNHFVARMEVKTAGSIYLSIQQKMKKHFRKNDSYQYSFCRVILGQINEKGKVISVINGKYQGNQSIILRENLSKGEYIIVIEADWVQKFYNEVIVTAYAKTKISFTEEPIKKYDVFSLYEGFLKALLHKPDEKKHVKSRQYDHAETTYKIWKHKIEKFGMVGVLFSNREEEVALNTRIEIQKFNNMELYTPGGTKDIQSVDIKLEPKSERMVIFKAKIADLPEEDKDDDESKKNKAYSYEYGEMFRLSNSYSREQLKVLCREKGKKVQSIQNGLVEVYKLVYLGGIAEYYVNKTTDKTFKQEVVFEALNISVNGKEPADMSMVILPEGDFLIDMKVRDMYKGSRFTRKPMRQVFV